MNPIVKTLLIFGAIMLATSAQGKEAHCVSKATTNPNCNSSHIERNKDLVKSLFDIINGTSVERIAEIDNLVAEDYVQHNPRVPQGREGLREFLKFIVPLEPKEIDPAGCLSVTFIGEGDYVVRQEIRTNGMLVDIFRIQNGKLKEHWDAFRFAPGAKVIPGF